MTDTPSTFDDTKVIVLLGRTGSGKTSLFNLLTNSNRPLGNSVSSTTKEFFSKTLSTNTFIDTIGFRDTENDDEHKLKVILFLKEIRNGFDIIFYCIRMDVFTADEGNLFSEIYETVLTRKAYSNSCLLITFYTRSDIDEVNTLDSPERQRLLEEFRGNQRYNQILDYFDNRIFFLDVRQEENLDDYSYGSTKYLQYRTINELIWERRQISYKHLSQFIDYFSPERFDCENMQTMREILWKNDLLEKELKELKGIITDVVKERSTTSFYELLRFMPITNMFVNVFETSRRERLDKRMNKVLQK